MSTVGSTTANSTTQNATGKTATDKSMLASNFDQFLTLLTTQLKNQNPLDPLDTNQFTQQLVEFASVEQQLKTNDQLASLIALQQTTQATQALTFVGKTAVVDGSTATMSNSKATWVLDAPSTGTMNVSITNSSGQTVYSGSSSVTAGKDQAFHWNSQANAGS